MAERATINGFYFHPSLGDKARSNRRKALIALGGENCWRCGEVDNLTLDHIVPRSWGGNSSIHNLQLLCFECNEEKGSTIADYRPYRPSLA